MYILDMEEEIERKKKRPFLTAFVVSPLLPTILFLGYEIGNGLINEPRRSPSSIPVELIFLILLCAYGVGLPYSLVMLLLNRIPAFRTWWGYSGTGIIIGFIIGSLLNLLDESAYHSFSWFLGVFLAGCSFIASTAFWLIVRSSVRQTHALPR